MCRLAAISRLGAARRLGGQAALAAEPIINLAAGDAAPPDGRPSDERLVMGRAPRRDSAPAKWSHLAAVCRCGRRRRLQRVGAV